MDWPKKVLSYPLIGVVLCIAGTTLFALMFFKVTRPGWNPGQPMAWEHASEPAFMLLLLGFLLLTMKRAHS